MPSTKTTPANSELATVGGGCFWCVEAVLEMLQGVHKVESGYAGGSVVNPSYEQVCGGRTGHAEVVQVTFDPAVLSYRDLLLVFISSHDPTTLNRQGADMGTQYRSAIFYHTPEQKKIAEDLIAEIEKDHALGIVTEVLPVPTFYPAEAYHQGYFRNHPGQGYCQAVIVPKVAKLRQHFTEMLARPTAS